MMSSYLSSLRLACLLFLASNLLLASADAVNLPPACEFTKADRTKPLPHVWMEQDLKIKEIVIPPTTADNVYKLADTANKNNLDLKLTPSDITITTDLNKTGRLRMVRITSKTGKVAYVYITDQDNCSGKIDGTVLLGDDNEIGKVELITLKGKPGPIKKTSRR